jgi:RNA polymerase sigma factor for flagellar operon FliA
MSTVAKAYQDVARRQRRDQLVMEHMDYVNQICRTLARQLPGKVDLASLLQAGVVGLLQAAERFDESRNVSFRAYSYQRIRGAILDELRHGSPLTQRVLENAGRVRKAIAALPGPSDFEAIAAATQLTVDEVEECLAALRVASPLSFDDASLPGREPSPEEKVQQSEREKALADAIERLPRRDRLVIQMYYLEELRLKEIGEVLGLSESRVSRVLARAELRLRTSLSQHEL